jgi:MFS family permease
MMPWRTIAICYVGWMFDFYDLALFSFLLTQIGHEFHLSLPQEAWLLGIGLGASGLGGILFGWLADRYGRKNIMSWTVAIYSLGTALSAFAPTALVFFILRTVTGLGIGGEWAVGHALVAESVPAEHRGKAAAWLQSGEPVGVALAAFMGFIVAPKLGWRNVMLISGCTGLWSLVIRAYLPESKLWKSAEQGVGHARRLRNARAWLKSAPGIWVMFRAFLLALFKLGTYWTVYTWLPKFFLTRFHEPIGRSFLWILTAQVGQFIGMMAFGPISDKMGRRQAYTWYSALTALALGCLAFNWVWLLEHKFCFWLTMAGLGLGSGCTAGFGALLAELFPTEVRNFGMGATYNLARGMQVFAPPIVAACAARWDLAGALSVPLVLAVLTGTWVWTLPETRGRNLAAIQTS